MIKQKHLDSYYKQALAIAEQSPDEQTKVASLLIHSETRAVLGNGFNGFVRGAPDAKLPKTRPEKYDYIVHAETNMIYNSARHGVSTDKCFVFCTLSPCVNCCRAMYQAGIKVVYFKEKYRDFDKQTEMLDLNLTLKSVFSCDYYKLTISPKE